MSAPSYAYVKRLGQDSFGEVVEKVTEALKSQGFGVLTKIDVKQTLKQKLDVDFREYLILGACNPELAHSSLQTEEHMGLLLPCNVVVQETAEGEVVVSIANPAEMFKLVDNADIADVAEEADRRIREVLTTLG